MGEMIERVAKAICWNNCPRAMSDEDKMCQTEGAWDMWQNEARAAIEAMRDAPTWVIVAMVNTVDDNGGRLHRRKWEAAIDAALAEPEAPAK